VYVIDEAHDVQQGMDHLVLLGFGESLGIERRLLPEKRRIEITLTEEGNLQK